MDKEEEIDTNRGAGYIKEEIYKHYIDNGIDKTYNKYKDTYPQYNLEQFTKFVEIYCKKSFDATRIEKINIIPDFPKIEVVLDESELEYYEIVVKKPRPIEEPITVGDCINLSNEEIKKIVKKL